MENLTPRRSLRLMAKRQNSGVFLPNPSPSPVSTRKRVYRKNISESENLSSNSTPNSRRAKRPRLNNEGTKDVGPPPSPSPAEETTPLESKPPSSPSTPRIPPLRIPDSSSLSPSSEPLTPRSGPEPTTPRSLSFSSLPHSPSSTPTSISPMVIARLCSPSTPPSPQKVSSPGTSPNMNHSPSRSSKKPRQRSPSHMHVALGPKGKSVTPMKNYSPENSTPTLCVTPSKEPGKSIIKTPKMDLSPTLEKVWASGSEVHLQRLVEINTLLNTPTKKTSPQPIDPSPLKDTPRKLQFKTLNQLVEPHYYSPTAEPKRRLSKSPEHLHCFRDMRTGKRLSTADYKQLSIPDDWDQLDGDETSENQRTPEISSSPILNKVNHSSLIVHEEERDQTEGMKEEEVEGDAFSAEACSGINEYLSGNELSFTSGSEDSDGLAFGCVLF